MKKLLVAICLLLVAPAWGQGTFPLNNIPMGKGAGKSGFTPIAPGVDGTCLVMVAGVPKFDTCTTIATVPGGTNGQIQYNNAGAFGGESQVTVTQGGTGISNVTNTVNDVLASNGANGNFIHTALLTLLNTVCVASPSTCSLFVGTVNPAWYGAVCDGVTNDATALQAMITASANKTIFIPAGTCLTNSTLTIPSNTTITGAGREVSILKSTANPALSAINKSNISLTNFQILGTDSVTDWHTTTPVGPLSFVQDVSASVAGINYTISNMKFAGWNTSYWVLFSAVGSTHPLSNITFENNYFLTAAADIPTDATPSNNNNYGLVIYSGSAGNGQIQNTSIKNNRMEVSNMCFPITLFGNHYKWQITGNLVLSPGQTSTSHCQNGGGTTNNAYGILVYDVNGDGNPPTNGLVASNTILNPYASGIYFAGDGTVGHYTAVYNSFQAVISGNVITGQTSTDDATLPRAAVSINLATDITVVGNYLKDSYGGIAFSGQTSGVVTALANHCYSVAGSSYCLKLYSGANGSSNVDSRIIKGNYFNADANSILAVSSTGARFNTVDISDNTINAVGTGLNFASQFGSNHVIINGNSFVGPGTLASLASPTGLTFELGNNQNLLFTAATLPIASNGSSVFVSDGAPASSPCTGTSTGSTAFRQNNAWKCF